MKKWYDEEYKFEIEVTGFLRSDQNITAGMGKRLVTNIFAPMDARSMNRDMESARK